MGGGFVALYVGLVLIVWKGWRTILRQRETLSGRLAELEEALSQIKPLHGLLPICASCKNVRDDNGYWNQIETYLSQHSEAEFSHSICPTCLVQLYPEQSKKVQIRASAESTPQFGQPSYD